MHLPSKTLSAALVALLPLVAAVSPTTSECVRSSSRQAASVSTCGDRSFLAGCLKALPSYFFQTDIEICYLDAGCGPDEAAASAIELLTGCASDDEPDRAGDLKKRQGSNNNSNNSDNTDTPDANQDTEADATPTRNRPATTPTEDAETTDTPEKTDNQTPETEAPAVATVTRSGPTTAAAAQQTSSTGIAPSDCTSTTTITTVFCGVEDGQNSCTSTEIAKPTCKEGLLCRMDSSGVTTCMEKQNNLSTGGIIVAIVFSVAVVVSIALMTFFCCREKSQQKKLKAKMEAAAIAKASGAGKKNRNVSDRQPLMAQTQEGYGAPAYDGPPQGGEQNPFQDQRGY